MLANVSERTREIGIRRAIGATKGDILVQFIIETVLICLSGGVLGIFLGFGMAKMHCH
jgi:putative ABC transport system permease protein